jgi:transposase
MNRIVLCIGHRVKCQLRKLRRETRDKGLADRCQIVLLTARGRPRKAVAEAVGRSVSWVHRVLRRFSELGIAGLMDRREDNGQRKLEERYLAILHDVVAGSPQDYGYPRPTWTRELLVKVMEELTGVRVHAGTMSRALQAIRARLGRPRPVVGCPWPEARRRRAISMIRRAIQSLLPCEAAVYLDEVDIHLNPKIGPDWMNRGQQKQVVTPGCNVKRYICGAQDARNGQLTWVEGNRKNSLLFIEALKALLRAYPNKRTIHVVLDNYIIHSSRQTRAWLAEHGKRLRLHFLPPYCPQENKIERLWLDLHANVTRNHRCGSMEELMRRVGDYLTWRNEAQRQSIAEVA